MVRKIIWSMDRAEFWDMRGRFLTGLFFAWVTRGTTNKMEDFIVALLRGMVFIMNSRRFLPDHLPEGLPKTELLRSLLVHDPGHHRDGVSIEQALDAPWFFTFLGSSIEPKPWLRERISEVEALRKRASVELGEDVAKELWGESKPNTCRREERPEEGCADRKSSNRVAYW
jgi:hypothetical protein